jgi:hypothetical protein
MKRRHFIAMLSMAPVAVVAAKMSPKPNQDFDSVVWRPLTGAYQVGDVITLSGFVDYRINGNYRMSQRQVFEKYENRRHSDTHDGRADPHETPCDGNHG